MPVAAIYARYSSDEQRATSIDDQVRRCKALAAQHGYEVKEELVFSDAAVSGSAQGLDKRVAYHQLIEAWDARAFDALVVDEVSRLARDVLEIAKLQVKIGKTSVRLITADGLDSSSSGWQLVFGIKGAIGQHFLEENRHRVIRGMLGQLERKFMVGIPPFGYKREQICTKDGKATGTLWHINEREGEVLRHVFAMRYEGQSYAQIAAYLNGQGVPLRRKQRNKRLGGYWRASRVLQIVQNHIYRGVFVWNGSPTSRAKAKQEKRELATKEFARPELRIVEDAVWFGCNASRRSRPLRCGGRHPLAGLLTCGRCGATLAVATQRASSEKKGDKKPEAARPNKPKRITALHCVQCEQAHRANALKEGPPYVSASGVEALLRYVLEQVMTGEAVSGFKSSLTSLLSGDREAELAKVKAELHQAKAARDRFARMLAAVNGDDEVLEAEYFGARARQDRLSERVRSMEAGVKTTDRHAAATAQLHADPRAFLRRLFSPSAWGEEARAVLGRLFPSVVLLGKVSRFISLYEVKVIPGVLYAEATDTDVVDEKPVTLRFRVSTSARRPVVWNVEQLPEEHLRAA